MAPKKRTGKAKAKVAPAAPTVAAAAAQPSSSCSSNFNGDHFQTIRSYKKDILEHEVFQGVDQMSPLPITADAQNSGREVPKTHV